ncbi:MAG: TatA/E family twin arginine-targeting protein translocase [Synechococcaceae cyanobacterium ELA445]
MNIFGIGLPEMAVIAAIGLLVFGPKRLPELGKTLGRTLKGFQSASRDFEQEFRRAIETESVTAETVSSETLVSAEVAVTETVATDSPASQQPAAPSAASESPPA